MTTENRLRKIEDAMPGDPAIWVARRVGQSDNFTVTAPGVEGQRQMTANEIDRTLTGTVVLVSRAARKDVLR